MRLELDDKEVQIVLESRLLEGLNLLGPPPEYAPELGGCWLWTNATNDYGYGQIGMAGGIVYTHRAAYELYCEPIARGNVVDHLCRVTNCCNPNHLDSVDRATNLYRAPVMNGANRNRCKYGHDLTNEGSYYIRRDKGSKLCKKCYRYMGARNKGSLVEREPADA